MGPLWKILADNWDIILMYPVLFAAAVFIGWLAGWAVIRVVYNQRLAHQADMITNLRAVLEEKLPATQTILAQAIDLLRASGRYPDDTDLSNKANRNMGIPSRP